MNSFQTILASLLSSSAASALIGFFFWNRQKSVEFKWDYKKYILKKRQDAYDEVQKIIHLCLLKKTFRGNYQVNAFFDSEASLKDFIQFTEIVKVGWVSKEVNDILHQMGVIAKSGLDYLLDYDWEDTGRFEDYEGKIEPSDVLHEFGNSQLENITTLNNLLQQFYLDDIKELGNIDKFLGKSNSFI